MRIFSSELAHNYSSYTFGYTNYGQLELGDRLSEVYNAGFLPYSGSHDAQGIFYMARSARVPLKSWRMTSENRRIAKKFDGQFKKERTPLVDFAVTPEFIDFCLTYFAQRHGEHVMPRERLELILDFGIISTVVSYRKDGEIIGYVFEVADEHSGHYWYSFYDLSYAKQSLGLWLMLDCVRDAKEADLAHYYLGTVYGGKTLYKGNFEPLEWWNGEEWSKNMKALKEFSRTDEKRAVSYADRWKESQKPL
jgi:arginine-tRNA-protein transferase